MKAILIIILSLGIFIQPSLAQGLDETKLNTYFEELDLNNKFMGSVAISQNGEIIYSKSVGFSDHEQRVPATENTKYRIGSISKTFTAVLVMKGIEKDKISLNQTIDKYFPSIINSRDITIQNLLEHRSGIHNFTEDKGFMTWHTKSKTRTEMISIIKRGGSDFKPGSRAKYSNSNYVLLSFILEDCFQMSYHNLLEEFITTPLNLRNTYLDGKTDTFTDEAYSYSFANNWVIVPETDVSIPLGAGGIVSTPKDMVKFSNALFNEKLVNNNSLEILKEINGAYGRGLFQFRFMDKTGYGHGGSIDGFVSIFSYFPDKMISYAVTSNGINNLNMNDISNFILRSIYY